MVRRLFLKKSESLLGLAESLVNGGAVLRAGKTSFWDSNWGRGERRRGEEGLSSVLASWVHPRLAGPGPAGRGQPRSGEQSWDWVTHTAVSGAHSDTSFSSLLWPQPSCCCSACWVGPCCFEVASDPRLPGHPFGNSGLGKTAEQVCSVRTCG